MCLKIDDKAVPNFYDNFVNYCEAIWKTHSTNLERCFTASMSGSLD